MLRISERKGRDERTLWMPEMVKSKCTLNDDIGLHEYVYHVNNILLGLKMTNYFYFDN